MRDILFFVKGVDGLNLKMDDYEQPDKLSFANSAYAQIYRTDDIKKGARRYALSQNYYLWNVELDNLWRELAPDLQQKFSKNEKEIKSYYDKLNEINDKIISTMPLITGSHGAGFNKVDKKRNITVGLQYQYLQMKEIFLGELQNVLGKGTKWSDEDSDGM